MRKLISDMLSKHPNLTVIGTARNGKDALSKVQTMKPDVITMDIEMPLMNGLEALKEIMDHYPTPIVMLSSTTEIGAANTITAIEYGAVDFVAKPGGPISLNLGEVEKEIVEKVYAASKVRVDRLIRRDIVRKPILQSTTTAPEQSSIQPLNKDLPSPRAVHKKISKSQRSFVIIGTSTGGPRALQEVLTSLPANIPAPILIVQHMPPNFTKSLAERLNGMSALRIKEAEDGEELLNGVAYIAPGGIHLKFEKSGIGYKVRLDPSEPPRMGHRPSVDVLLESAALKQDLQYVTAIMTGMGHDGRDGMRKLQASCTTVTIAESEQTSVVYGMPKAIKDAGLADEVVDLQNIAPTIMEILLG
ncbi:chemotaxis response regulator protein-glutamate methylesterase [Sporosarcina contaminans]|uniref:Protein-glutamate methylesterase/protein-glutamine glutaminase n=1 Tax=Sporosarcina contaminans TaxID=633403 RepID=A0ABW3TXJ2_9BACL